MFNLRYGCVGYIACSFGSFVWMALGLVLFCWFGFVLVDFVPFVPAELACLLCA